ncbi:MAG: HAMP domain-containing histidine kinase [Desulfobulbaceae bacterium]|nr:HAMP domain-containing histidine kinase [Desulfobulbaceae bacterium]
MQEAPGGIGKENDPEIQGSGSAFTYKAESPGWLKKKWHEIFFLATEVDLTFLVLRLVSLVGGVVWLYVAPLAPAERENLMEALSLFGVYSFVCYIVIFAKPVLLRKVYLVSLLLDLFFLANLVAYGIELEDSFFLGFYLLVCLHTVYFGLNFGLAVATLASVFYMGSIMHYLVHIHWTDLALRLIFLYLIAIPVGLLSEKVKRDKKMVEKLNERLAQSLENLHLMQGKLIEAEKFSALGRLTADIAHEIRNPLTAVGGFARRLDRHLPDEAKGKEYASIIIREVDRLEKILVDTLIYGKVTDFELKRENLTKPVSAAISLYRELCMEQGITVEDNCAPGLPKAKINAAQVQQALDSLISNAIDAMPSGGTLTVSLGMEKQNDTNYLTISVCDNGTGIGKGIYQYIFEPFFSTKKIGKGTGLGLSIVQKIMEEHRGFVRVESCPGQGADFVLYFPSQDEEEDVKLPCWEYLSCGIETDSTRHCPAYPHFGRICWSTAGTYSEGRIKGICATKLENCQQCSFYQMVNKCLPLYTGHVKR